MTPLVTGPCCDVFAFLCGSSLSHWIGVVLHTDIRQFETATRGVQRPQLAAGRWASAAISSRRLQGLIPVALANFQGGVIGRW